MGYPHYTGDCASNVAAERVAKISRWVDEANADRGEALTWHRVAKCAEESGEALSALLGITGQNPRKGVHGSQGELIEELCDVAVAALGAVEHLTGNKGVSFDFLLAKISKVYERAGLGAMS